MKLYTEEQVRFLVNESRDCVNWWDIKYDLTQEEVISQVTPIELPSDEEIIKEVKPMTFSKAEYKGGFIEGMQYMRDKILNQNK